MTSIRRTLARIAALFGGHTRAEEDLRAEMDAHLEMETERFLRRGMSPDQARRQAMIASGGLAQAVELVREQRGIPWIESTAADLRYAIRYFRRAPLSTGTMILVLSLGIGTTVVVFTLLNSLATMPAPGVERDASLVRIRGISSGMDGVRSRLMSWPEVQEYAQRTELFGSVAAHATESAVVTAGNAASAPITVRLIYTTANYFGMLDVRPVLGSPPITEPGSTQLTSAPTAVISHAMWQQRFGGGTDVIGRTIRINDVPVQIVGVAPPRFLGTEAGRGETVWVPLGAYPLLQKRTPAVFLSHDSTFLSVTARLRDGVTTRAAASIVAGIAARTPPPGQGDAGRSASGFAERSASADVVPLLASNARVTQQSDLIASSAAAAGFALIALLITCTNVSALMVGLAVARRREIGVRLSLGAPRSRLIRQLLTESVLLAIIAAVVGLGITALGIRVLGARLEDVQLVVDWRVTLATCGVALVAGLAFGLSPALHATRISVAEILKSSATSVAAIRSRLQRALVVGQIALTQPLLVGLGVVIATLVADGGGKARPHVAERIAEIELDTWTGTMSPTERASRIDAIVERVAAIPGVAVAMPMQMGTVAVPLAVHPADRVSELSYLESFEASYTAAPEGYFEAFDIPIVRGRDFERAEYVHSRHDAPVDLSIDVAIIGSDLARRLWGNADPLGRRLTVALPDRPDASALTVVGIVDAAAAGPSEVDGRTRVYVPYATLNSGVIARTTGPALPMLDAIRRAVAAEAPQLPIYRVETMEQREAAARRDLVRASSAAAAGGVLALLLSAIGLYAVVAFTVGQRTREIGIRTALGAQRSEVVRMFFSKGLVLSVLGLILGLPLSMLVIRVVAQSLHLPLTGSPLLGVAIAAVVLIVASVAAWLPARRASRVDPVVALRAE